jgi:uncharacterized protein (DUF2062 family)
MKIYTNFKRFIKLNLIKLMRIRDNMERIARGFAWGTFLAIWPSMPFNSLLALLCAPMFGGNRIAALIGSWVVGPFVVAPIYYYLSYLTGKYLFLLLGISVKPITFLQMENFLKNFSENPYQNTLYYLTTKDGFTYFWGKISGFFWAMEIGGAIIGAIGAYMAYKSISAIELWFVRHKQKILKRKKGERNVFR